MIIPDLLTTAGINATVSSNADPSTATTSAQIYQLANPLVTGGCHPLRLPDEQNPDEFAVYQPVGLNFIESDGHRLGRIDSYVLTVRSPSYTRLEEISTQLVDSIANHTGPVSLDIADMAADYEPDQKQCRVHMELTASTLASAIAWPACLVHPIGAKAAADNLSTGGHSQSVIEQFAVVCIAPDDQIQTLRDQVATAVIGQSHDQYSDTYQYEGGQPIGVTGSITYWREVYSYRRYIRSH